MKKKIELKKKALQIVTKHFQTSQLQINHCGIWSSVCVVQQYVCLFQQRNLHYNQNNPCTIFAFVKCHLSLCNLCLWSTLSLDALQHWSDLSIWPCLVSDIWANAFLPDVTVYVVMFYFDINNVRVYFYVFSLCFFILRVKMYDALCCSGQCFKVRTFLIKFTWHHMLLLCNMNQKWLERFRSMRFRL